MNTEVIKEWCAALRSGEYKKTLRTLQKSPEDCQYAKDHGIPQQEWTEQGAFCALGVLAKIKEKEIPMTLLGNGAIPDEALCKLKIRGIDQYEIAQKNDFLKDGPGTMGMPFTEIADFIEEKYIKPYESEEK